MLVLEPNYSISTTERLMAMTMEENMFYRLKMLCVSDGSIVLREKLNAKCLF